MKSMILKLSAKKKAFLWFPSNAIA